MIGRLGAPAAQSGGERNSAGRSDERSKRACVRIREFDRSAYSHFKVYLSRLDAACAATEGRLPEAPADVERAVGQFPEVDTRTACDGAHKHTCNDAGAPVRQLCVRHASAQNASQRLEHSQRTARVEPRSSAQLWEAWIPASASDAEALMRRGGSSQGLGISDTHVHSRTNAHIFT